MSTNTATPRLWRRHSTKEFTALALLISLAVFLVHQTTLSRENAKLPMDRVLTELEANCAAVLHGGEGSSVAKLPPAFFGLGVWVDTTVLLPGVHAALDFMKERLAGDAGAAATVTGRFSPPTHSLHSFVRVQSATRDTAVAELLADAHRDGRANANRVTRRLELVASQQQLGMPTMKHAFLPQVGQEVELHGLSLFSVPAAVLPEGEKVQCYVTDVQQAYCVFPIDAHVEAAAADPVTQQSDASAEDSHHALKPKNGTSSHASAPASTVTEASYRTYAKLLEEEVRAAMLSVMTRQLGLRSFKPADVAAWRQKREQQGCAYTMASVGSTLRSIEANTNMVIPLSTRHMFADLEQHVQARAFVRAARAADDLQFHPSLTPQLYIPWDHALVSQLVILLPMASMTILTLRFVVDERRLRRAKASGAVVAQEKKTQ
jgi:hypothetical protein